MTLGRRISLFVFAVIASTSVAIAVVAAVAGRSTAQSQVDQRLIELRSAIAPANDPVSALLNDVATSTSRFAVVLVVDDEPPLDLLASESDSAVRITSLTVNHIREAAAAPITITEEQPIRIVALAIGDNEWLVFGESVRDISNAFKAQIVFTVVAAAVVALIGFVVVWAAMRRELAPLRDIVRYSESISAGQLGSTLAVGGTTQDIRVLQTSIRTMVDGLRSAVEIRARSEAEMRDFLADVAHELRTPLTTIRAYADVLSSQQPVDETIKSRAQERIAHESKRMSKLIDDLLLLARLAATKSTGRSPTELGKVVATHLNDLQTLDPQRPISVTSTESWVLADATLMDRLFANIASNIHRHTPATAAVMADVSSSAGYVTCTFDDAGPGIEPQELTRLAAGTERFGSLRSGDRHGTGLGLHLISSIVRSHDGVTAFERSPLGGLRVVIRLPAMKRTADVGGIIGDGSSRPS